MGKGFGILLFSRHAFVLLGDHNLEGDVSLLLLVCDVKYKPDGFCQQQQRAFPGGRGDQLGLNTHFESLGQPYFMA